MQESSHTRTRKVFITGAAGGLGSELVRIFHSHGYHVIAADIFPGNYQTVTNETIQPVVMDVTDKSQVRALTKDLDLENSGLDILISAAGIYESFPVTSADPLLFSRIMDVNLHGTVNLVQALLGPLSRHSGRVIVISSESYKVQAMFQPYMITKAALESYCRAARQELALKGVKMIVIRPGAINTGLLKWMDSPDFIARYPVFSEELRKSWQSSVKMVGKMSAPQSVAWKVYIAATARRPKRVYRVNNSLLVEMISWLPGSVLDWLMVKLFKK